MFKTYPTDNNRLRSRMYHTVYWFLQSNKLVFPQSQERHWLKKLCVKYLSLTKTPCRLPSEKLNIWTDWWKMLSKCIYLSMVHVTSWNLDIWFCWKCLLEFSQHTCIFMQCCTLYFTVYRVTGWKSGYLPLLKDVIQMCVSEHDLERKICWLWPTYTIRVIRPPIHWHSFKIKTCSQSVLSSGVPAIICPRVWDFFLKLILVRA